MNDFTDDRSDLGGCAAEPIHIPGSIQPHGVLLAIRPDGLEIVQASGNVAWIVAGDVLGRVLTELPGMGGLAEALRGDLPSDGTATLCTLESGGQTWAVVAHRLPDLIIVEFEVSHAGAGSLDVLHPRIRRGVEALQAVADVPALAASIAQQVRELTDFDRVLVYRFDEDWNGIVIAEEGNGALPSYMNLRFPAADIPAQARELYRLNRLRLIPDAGYEPVPILPADPLDLSHSVLRSVSPVHAQYMRNMGTAASMSISILDEGRLWGLIACHNALPKRVPIHVRNACDFLGQIAAMLIGARTRSAEAAERVALHAVEARLLSYMAAEPRFIDGLTRHADDVLELTDAKGAALIFDGRCHLLGATPTEDQVLAITDWLNRTQPHDALFQTNALATHMPGAETFAEVASGVMGMTISQLHASYMLWFRPEVVQTVSWGGDPRKETGSINPRESFAAWRELVHQRAEPWTPAQMETVRSLQGAVTGIVMRKAEEMAELTEELRRSNKELEAFSYSVSHDLRAPFRHIVGYAELLREEENGLDARGRRYLDTIIESAFSAGRLVDDLLNFSQMGRAVLTPLPIDMNKLVAEVRRMLRPETEGRRIEWHVADLHPGVGDASFLRSVWQNLLSNAIKYTRGKDPASITITSTRGTGETVWSVADDGVGFDMAYVEKLFGVFQRLHRMEDYEGSGIGLANVRRIVERHGGRTWAEGALGKGATFHFALPDPVKEKTWQN
ncbi:ATP-binding protein [Falsirhodobacter xinxiangensis]|uniref:ATP-binding protein n=1 Tax=Falsirhodobacter xinxiangensis TaxID=2530049 RepID=UPI0010AA992F|nr:ATP-binding protein [Rhodobacter xinxiangensis]